MKKTLPWILILCAVMLLFAQAAVAEEAYAFTKDQFKESIAIQNWGTFTPTGYEQCDVRGTYAKGSRYFDSDALKYSGEEMDYALLYVNILNETAETRDYLKNATVTVVVGDSGVSFEGFARQRNYDNEENFFWDPHKNEQNIYYSIHEDDQFAITPFMNGHFLFGCKLPNAVFTTDMTVKMIITLDDHQFVYTIR